LTREAMRADHALGAHRSYSVVTPDAPRGRARPQVLRGRRDEDRRAVARGGIFEQRRQSWPHAELPRQTARRLALDANPSHVPGGARRKARPDFRAGA